MIHAHTRQKGFKKSRLAVAAQISERTGKNNSLLASMPKCRFELLYLWTMYNSILKGCENITYNDIRSFEQVTGDKLSRWEANVMIDVDLMRRRHAHENR